MQFHRPSQPISSGRKRTSWGKIFATSYDSSNLVQSSSSPSYTASFSQVVELSMYLDSDTICVYDDDLDVLNWWNMHKQTYHVLSILAKNVLTVLVSTISWDSIFSLCGRLLEERRRSLTSDMVEILTCLKDW